MKRRASGVLIHITSLPSRFGVGDLGPWSYKFVDFLRESRQTYWQILPLNPTDTEYDSSPYHSVSAFACNPLLISPEYLLRDGWILEEDLMEPPAFSGTDVDYRAVTAYKYGLLDRAYQRFSEAKVENPACLEFRLQNAHWLHHHALFVALKAHFEGRPWTQWPEQIRDGQAEALRSAEDMLNESVKKQIFIQFLFSHQWGALKRYCSVNGISLIGDLPFYVTHDSADVWAHPELFNLGVDKNPITVAGVPPDYFSETGQLWGNPVYRWDAMADNGYDWWIKRVRHNLQLYDLVRIDHFRGFAAYWEVPAKDHTAMDGAWVEGPGDDFFRTLLRQVERDAIIAEDLGFITPDVTRLMQRFGFPGMKLLLFAFVDDPARNPYAPHNHIENCIVYTGTHDNNTARGWFDKELSDADKERIFRYLGRRIESGEIHHELVRLAMMSVARTVVIPMQDILGLGEEARMNRPSTNRGNWKWRLESNHLTPALAERLRELTETYGRA